MAKLSIVVKNQTETKTIRVEGLDQQLIATLIRETVWLPSASTQNLKVHISHTAKEFMESVEKDNHGPKIVPKPSVEVEKKEEETKLPPGLYVKMENGGGPAVPSRSKKLPLLGSENRSSFALGEFFPPELKNSKTGENGELLLKTYVKCPDCGSEHKGRFTKPDNAYIKCFDCKTKLELWPVSIEKQFFEGQEIPQIGPDGYYLVAKTYYDDEPLFD